MNTACSTATLSPTSRTWVSRHRSLPSARAPLTRTPDADTVVQLHEGGYSLDRGRLSVGLRSTDSGAGGLERLVTSADVSGPVRVTGVGREAIQGDVAFADVLADVMQVERVSVDSNFFDDLGADSMVMARFCAQARKRDDVPSVSMKDVYRHPTIRGLATALAPAQPVAGPTAAARGCRRAPAA